MEINLNSEQVLSLILDSLNNKKPFMITRIGDGEAIAYENEKNNQIVNQVYNRHLGVMLDEKKRNEISKNLIDTIKNSDVLSLKKNHNKPEMFYWKKVPEIYKKILSENELNNKLFCDHDTHFSFTDKKFLDKLMVNVTDLTLITSRDVEIKFRDRYSNLKTITTYKIPAENKFEENKKIEQYYPNIFDDIKNKILSKNHSGHLLLLGGGFVGKKLGDYFKQTGGVSVDIGSVFDLWVGKITRGPNRGSNSYAEPLL